MSSLGIYEPIYADFGAKTLDAAVSGHKHMLFGQAGLQHSGN